MVSQIKRLVRILVVLGLFIAASCAPSPTPTPTPSGPTPTPTSFTPQILTPTNPAQRLDDKFIWVGNGQANQFTQIQYENLANNYDLLVLDKAHGFFSRPSQEEAAQTLKSINPHLQILAYFSATLHFDMDNDPGHVFNMDWALRDTQGNIIRSSRSNLTMNLCEADGEYVDLSNPDYRAWVVQVLKDWFAAAPFDGVMFDTATFITPDMQPNSCLEKNTVHLKWQNLLDQTRIDAVNNGLVSLFQAVRAQFPDKVIDFNGVSSITDRTEHLQLFQWANTAMDEDFCLQSGTSNLLDKDRLLQDVQLMQQLTAENKGILAKTNHPSSWQPSDPHYIQVSRYCYGVFLLGYAPGLTYYKFGYGYDAPNFMYNVDEITQNPLEINLNLGQPQSPYQQTGDVYYREFENAIVYVNMDSSAQTITLPQTLQRVENGVPGQRFSQNASYSIPAQDAVFFLKTD